MGYVVTTFFGRFDTFKGGEGYEAHETKYTNFFIFDVFKIRSRKAICLIYVDDILN